MEGGGCCDSKERLRPVSSIRPYSIGRSRSNFTGEGMPNVKERASSQVSTGGKTEPVTTHSLWTWGTKEAAEGSPWLGGR